MRLNGVERSEIETIFQPEIHHLNQFQEIFDAEICRVLEKQGKIRSVADKITYRESTSFRPYDTAVLSKVITPKFDISESIIDLIDSLTRPFLFFLDFNFAVESQETNSAYDSNLKIQLGSKASAVNRQIKIISESDAEVLKNEIKSKSYAEFLSLAFIHHNELFELSSSGLRPYQLIGLHICLQKFP